MSDALRVLIADDEPHARARMRELLAAHAGVEVVGECGDGAQTVRAIASLSPELVFLDVQMPELDGFGVVQAIGVDRMPAVIFVTAYDEHALRAFEVHAIDYLLKPVDRERFTETLTRAARQIRAGAGAGLERRLLDWVEKLANRQSPGRLAIRVEGSTLFLRADEIDWLEAHNNHVRVHTAAKTHLVRETLTNFLRRLPPGRFLRVHRSSAVNVERIKEVQPWFAGDYVLILVDGSRVTSGRSYRQDLRRFLEHAS
jgi:two-component system LytT family response regulator